jgi:c-di-GMP-binding flagellar brake protein YcgR
VASQDPDSFGQRRKYTRRDVQLQARVRAGERDLIATAENISPGGAFLRIEEPVEAEDLFATIQLPHGRGVHVHAKVRWRRAEPPGIGVEFATFLEGPWEEISRSA